jgi:lytic murein transglycosylase
MFADRSGSIMILRLLPVVRLQLVVMLSLCMIVGANHAAAADSSFARWLESTWPDARKLGVSRATFDAATRGLTPDLSLPDLVIPGRPPAKERGQAEFVQTPADYLKDATLERLATQGRQLAARYRDTLARIERMFGVPGPMVLAIWGRETAYGGAKLGYDAVRVLATQGYTGRRKALFRNEFVYALKMLEDGYPRADMRSSWGGAMGLTQFIPSEFYKYAVDLDGNGRADIFNSVPDALASAAKQLHGKGWQPGSRWAVEVKVPAAIDCAIAEPDHKRSVRDWRAHGYVPLTPLSAAEQSQEASLLMPEGIYGPAFLTFNNYYVIKEYNFADLYVLFVGSLADRIAGGGGFRQAWSKRPSVRSHSVEEIQRVLTASGYYGDKIDGKAGMKTRSAIGAYQTARRLKQDCWPSEDLLRAMQAR